MYKDLKYCVRIPDPRVISAEKQEWCEANIGKYCIDWVHVGNWGFYTVDYYFRNEEDAIMFKLMFS